MTGTAYRPTVSLDTPPGSRTPLTAREIVLMFSALLLGVAIMVGVTVALLSRSDEVHANAMRSIKQADALLLTDCRKDLARLDEVRQLEMAAMREVE